MATFNTIINADGSKSFKARIRLKGYPTQTQTFKRLTDARRWAAATETRIREGRHFEIAEARKHTFNDLVSRYAREVLPAYIPKEQRDRLSKLRWWAEGFGCCLLADLNAATITERKADLKRQPATVDKYLKNLSHALNTAMNQWGWITHNPVKKIKGPRLPRGRVRFLGDDERNRLLDACRRSDNDYLYPCVVLALSTGMRKGELMNLTWPDVNLAGAYIILQQTKNGERRRVPLTGLALELLRQHHQARRLDTDLLFPGRDPLAPVDLRKSWLRTLEQAGIDDFRWHDLRHCTASYLAMNGASLAEIAEILGHKTLAMVKRYSHLSDGHVSRVVESMNAKLFEPC